MRLVFTHNGAYDSILLVDEDNNVHSEWDATPKTVREYLCDGNNPDEWDNQGHYDDGLTIADFGEVVGENGQLSDKRREFWSSKL